MIKAGIFGEPDLKTKELVRLLLNHPDIELVSIVSPDNAGKSISSSIGDLYGDTDLCFSGRLDASAIDILFIGNDRNSELSPESLLAANDKLKIVNLEITGTTENAKATVHGAISTANENAFVYGLAEINRKTLVRGARAAVCPTPLASAAILALFPLAKNLMLNSSISISFISPIEKNEYASHEITEALKAVQTSFNADITISHAGFDPLQPRTTVANITLHNNIDRQEIRRIFNETYNDHNFTYLLPEDVKANPENVLRTNKCLISIREGENGELQITSIVDNLLKGAAGNAVHCMNLLFGLHEKTGLSLIGGADFHNVSDLINPL